VKRMEMLFCEEFAPDWLICGVLAEDPVIEDA
jgi:hypothetical protein